MNLSKLLLLFVALIEGGSLMAVELLGAKLINPYFGISPYVWAAVLAVTLTGLAFGYLVGGRVSKRNVPARFLWKIILLAALIVFILPQIAGSFLGGLINIQFELGVIIAAFFILALPLFLFGIVSPVIIELITVERSNSGKNAGLVYAISTLGGIFFTFLFGFYLIPYHGVSLSALYIAVLLVVASIVVLFINKKEQLIKAKASG